ncbi:OLC1v1010406C1 [Oldenlandia corymbosa var. corymbosa]|uniref:OLC1v1010406C1 n=1 Tax=Oldenlandia corymbosa var. corymbosa TaxID=529605 RepID=A0AAV1DTZ9_OLDCO|nr:OLC1v1010406C1 [Oldenlandia corymbosa var. corymbosa]
MESERGENPRRKLLKRCDDADVSGDDQAILVDRISHLPEAILCHILSFLPTKSAVATSFLSKSWDRRWTKVTNFDFKDLPWRRWRTTGTESSLSANPGGGVPKMDFVGFVNMVLLNQSRENSINRFRLQIKNRPFVNFSFIFLNIWVTTAVTRNVRVLDLDLSPHLPLHDDSDDDYHDSEFHLPDALYNCGTLEVLKLEGAFLIKPPSMVSLPKLTDLELLSVKFDSDESFSRLISGCRMIHSLVMSRDHCNDGMTVCTISSPVLKLLQYSQDFCQKCDMQAEHHLQLKIDTPALQRLTLFDFLTEVIVRGLTSLDEVNLEIPYIQPEKTVRLIQAFDYVNSLALYDSTMRIVSKAINTLSSSFDKLTKLAARVECCQFSHLMSLIDRCATLKSLQIGKCRVLCPHHDKSLGDPPRRIPKCFLSSLTHVSFLDFEGHENEMALLRFIADHASRLTTLNVRRREGYVVPEEKMHLLEQRLSSSAVSPTCAISIS